MKYILCFFLGIIVTGIAALIGNVCYERGKLQVISDCNAYGRYALDGTQALYCSMGPLTPEIVRKK